MLPAWQALPDRAGDTPHQRHGSAGEVRARPTPGWGDWLSRTPHFGCRCQPWGPRDRASHWV